MTLILVSITSGIALGYFFNKQERSRNVVDFILNGLFLLLILVMGISLGTNEDLVNDFYGLGLQSLFLSVSCVAGSISVIYLSGRIFERYT